MNNIPPRIGIPRQSFSNGLRPDQAERLAILSEELAATSKAIAKILRHGYESFDPTRPAQQLDGVEYVLTNRDDLERELGSISAAMSLLFMAGEADRRKVSAYAEVKMQRFPRFLHHFALNVPEQH